MDAAAQLLHVTPRTVRYWISGQVTVPYAAYRLVRVMRLFELPCEGWEGWHMHSGKLWTPEGFGFTPKDQGWWSLLVRQARLFRQLIERDHQVAIALQRTVEGPVRMAQAGPESWAKPDTGPVAPDAPTGVAGRAAKPAGLNLSNKHFRTRIDRIPENPPLAAIKTIVQGVSS